MSGQPRQQPARLGATFMPGSSDDFYMPTEVVSPAPQRVTPEVPGRIQDNLTRLELDATPSSRLSGLQSPVLPDGYTSPIDGPISRNSSVSTLHAAGQHPPARAPPAEQKKPLPVVDTSDQPSFSPFPPLKKRPANVPPSDDEKEAILEKARVPVLSSNDPEVQLTWAQDALQYVEIAAQNEARITDPHEGRPQTPQIEHQLRVDAINIVKFLAEQHHPKAEFQRGVWLEFGKFGFRMDKKEAFRCYQRAAQRGYARAEYRMGMQFEGSNEPEKALKHYNLGVQQGDSASNYRLGMMTLLGQHGQSLNYEKGIKLISYSAETADENAPQGAYVFGMLQARELPQINLPERFLDTNMSGARYNIEKAAYLGFAKAQAKMGSAYELCQLGCAFDPALSLHYNALAARQGEADAEMAISKWFLCGYEGIFEKNEELAFRYAQRAAQIGLPNAEFAVGYFYEVGIHVSADLTKSRSWYEKAAEHGNKDAIGRIDGIARSKTLSRKDHENTAVAKIKSQYGSHRGKRPDRFKASTTPLTPIADEYHPIDMPEPRLTTPKPGQYRPSPYPSANGQDPRPPSVAPYPVDDAGERMPYRSPNSTLAPNQNLRRPLNPRSASSAHSESSFGDSNYRGSAFPTFRPNPRPQAAGPPGPVLSPGPGRGRGGALPPLHLPNVQNPTYRKPPPGLSSPHPPPSPATVQRPPSAQPPQQPPQAPGNLPKIDIGFSAPPDLSGADKPRRSQGQLGQPPAKSPVGYPPPNSGHGQLAGRVQDPKLSLPHTSSMPSSPHIASPQVRPMSAGRGGPPPARPATSHAPTRVDGASIEGLPPPPSLGSTNRPTNTPPPAALSNTPKPPGKGPKTFSEMGLPPTKQENDCVIM